MLLFENGHHTHRICAPGGLATAPLADGDREATERAGTSESDWGSLADVRRDFHSEKGVGTG